MEKPWPDLKTLHFLLSWKLDFKKRRTLWKSNKLYQVQPIPVAAPYKASVCDRSFARTGGFDSARWYGCPSIVSVVYCQVEVSTTSWLLVQRSPTLWEMCVCVCVSLSVVRWNNIQCINRKGQNGKDRKKRNDESCEVIRCNMLKQTSQRRRWMAFKNKRARKS
jgi:hypothetical protein